jgi:hypothetical protein
MKPEFLVIGARKSGSTWLYQNLLSHPQLWFPPEKEIHFFDLPPLIPFYFLLFAPERGIRNWCVHRLRRDFKKVMAGQQSWQWYISYYFGIRTWRWYVSLFTPARGQSAGEITPGYAAINEIDISKLKSLLPNCKFIYLLRNPIDRMWSDLAMYHGKNFGGNGVNLNEQAMLKRFLNNKQHLRHSSYAANLKRWEKYFPKKQILICYHDQIQENPETLLREIFEFIGVDSTVLVDKQKLYKKINKQEYPPIPHPIARELAKILMPEFELLHAQLKSDYTANWLEKAKYAIEG